MLWKDCLLSSLDICAKNTFENSHLSSNAQSSEKKKKLLRKWRLSGDSKTCHSTVIELPQPNRVEECFTFSSEVKHSSYLASIT